MAINLDKVYILNPAYFMRSDINRILLATTHSNSFDDIGKESLSSYIHPIHAMMLSFFKGDNTLENTLNEISYFFEISFNEAYELASRFIDNEEKLTVIYDNYFFRFPKKVLIEFRENFALRNYSIKDFNITADLDFKSARLNIPMEGSILINNKCVTDCLYCYADKRKILNCTIPFQRIKEIIAETRLLKFRNFDINGGELFLYDRWYDLLSELYSSNYSVYLTTKVPITENQIDKLKDLGVKEIQISLDSIFPNDLNKNLGVDNAYRDKILKSIELLNKKGFSIKLKSIITSYIFNINHIEDYIDFFKQYENIKIVEFTAPAHSCFKSQNDFLGYRLSLENIKCIEDLISRKQSSCFFHLNADVGVETKDTLSFNEKKEKFLKRAKCTGNQSSFMILPNGDVTLCEETYFNKNLIIGNILNNSIMDVWNSDRAKNLFYIPQSNFTKENPCSTCSDFSKCRHDIGVCWVDSIAAYGDDNWMFPPPDCPYAPPSKRITYYE